ncbi:MAG: ComEC family competence protein, partial [Bacilli bacterium]|nr:ComEC family competence protein [Bacilli bacterium]
MLRLKTILQSSHLILCILIITIIYALIYSIIPRQSKFTINDTKIKGTLISKSIDGDKLTIVLKGKEKIKGTFYIKNYEYVNFYENIPLGTNILVSGSLSIPSKNTIPNTFNYHDYLYYQGINYTISINDIQIDNSQISWLYKIKNALIKHIKKYQSKAYLLTFILGDKSSLENGVYEEYQNIGVSHIFAISGMHVSLLTGIILKLLKKLKENTRYIIVIVFLLIYSFLTDFQPSILRSVTLFILLFLNKRFSFNLDTLRVYYLTIILLLLCNPYLIHNVGFQYSSVVSYSLIRNSKIIKGNYLMKCFKISLIAFIYSIPITALNNYEINILSIFNNLLYVP